ncbi:(2Fe-2S)-binding protein [Alicyclobacillus fastidiosus]|uniref:(2Fe-2S)-binding protein n=1 Tax=Alicyclobacillus fastidiosus TaxID=392011 RepID=A0ABY6ZIK9_9BACL|nr:(2Fe-2S)-binding protein [Alicyclobacillus fastidiosus]WAH42722.1 (2Fe-2S)-binding protein [Alicyclobacillus fastidiosus]GMA64617.1 (2Fe-2S)-binding protein [Alicyclobacillus fastidiosus]
MNELRAVEKVTITLRVNGEERVVSVEPRWLLSDVLRHGLGLVGTHVGCEQGVCGSCTVLVDGQPTRSCLQFAVQAEGSDIVTIEGVTQSEGLTPLQRAFAQHHALQCGFCTPGMVLTAQALLDKVANPDEETIREALSGNICRCTGYQSIVDAVMAAAGTAKNQVEED